MPNFLLEVGTEDLPAGFVESATKQWQQMIPARLQEQNLAYSAVQVYSTPRRLAVLIEDLPDQQLDRTEEIKGPPASAAFKDGQPTPAGAGFAKKQGVALSDLTIRPTDKGDFVFINKQIPGRQTTAILTEQIPQWIFGLEGKRMMRWADGDLKFPRPIRWLVALWGNAIMPITLVNDQEEIKSDRISQTHRVLHPEPVSIASPETYVHTLAQAAVKVVSRFVGRSHRLSRISNGSSGRV
jgi:glycyl-tRNA synthetase beta chain